MGPILPISDTATGIFMFATGVVEKLQLEHTTNESNANGIGSTASCFGRAQSASLAS